MKPVVVLSVAIVLAGCAEGGSGPAPGPGGGLDARVPSGDGGTRPDSSISLRPDAGPRRVDAGPAGCPEICMLPNATSSCGGDRCVIDACDPGFGDCDTDDATGCEAPLDTDDNCGACGMTCTFPNATGICASGTCALGMCNPGFGDCNAMDSDGCETALDSTTHCGACGNACPSGSTCTGGSCSMASCPAGTSNCDGDSTNGCEVDHAAFSNACAMAEDLGAAPGDVACGFLCPGASFRALATREGNRGRWFRARVQEASSCPADVYHCFRLEVPAGVDYDLFAYSACGTLLGSLPAGPGATEEFCVYRADGFSGDDDSFDYWLEVRHRTGQSCFNWRLTVEHSDC